MVFFSFFPYFVFDFENVQNFDNMSTILQIFVFFYSNNFGRKVKSKDALDRVRWGVKQHPKENKIFPFN